MCSSQVIRNSSIYVFACVLNAALGYIQFGFTCDYSSPTEAAITKDLGLTVSESLMIAGWLCISFAKNFRLLYNTKGRFCLHSIRDEEPKVLISRSNYPVRTERHPFLNTYVWSHISNDTIMIDMEENKIVEFIKFDVGNVVMVAGGTNRGCVSVIKNSVKHK
ncbi:unnamed protein product [Brassica oleracea var. botrytis]